MAFIDSLLLLDEYGIPDNVWLSRIFSFSLETNLCHRLKALLYLNHEEPGNISVCEIGDESKGNNDVIAYIKDEAF